MGKSGAAERGVTGGVTSGFIVLCGEGGGVSAGTTFWPSLELGVLQPGDYLARQGCRLGSKSFVRGPPPAALLGHWAVVSVICVLTLLAREGSHWKD